MKIAFASNDGSNISRHFGRSEFYVVVETEDNKVLSRKLVSKESAHVDGEEDGECCGGHGHDHDHNHQHGQGHGHHEGIFEAIQDCQVVISGGMGSGAVNRLRNMGIQAILTTTGSIDEALKAFLEGRLVHVSNLAH